VGDEDFSGGAEVDGSGEDEAQGGVDAGAGAGGPFLRGGEVRVGGRDAEERDEGEGKAEEDGAGRTLRTGHVGCVSRWGRGRTVRDGDRGRVHFCRHRDQIKVALPLPLYNVSLGIYRAFYDQSVGINN